jgi:uridine phosphorylase
VGIDLDGHKIGVLGCAVAVLIAEEIFTLGCELLISVISSGEDHAAIC